MKDCKIEILSAYLLKMYFKKFFLIFWIFENQKDLFQGQKTVI